MMRVKVNTSFSKPGALVQSGVRVLCQAVSRAVRTVSSFTTSPPFGLHDRARAFKSPRNVRAGCPPPPSFARRKCRPHNQRDGGNEQQNFRGEFMSQWVIDVKNDVDAQRIGALFGKNLEIIVVLAFALPAVAVVGVVRGDDHDAALVVEPGADVHVRRRRRRAGRR